MQNGNYMLAYNGIGVELCVENGLVSFIRLFESFYNLEPIKENNLFFDIYSYLSGKMVDFSKYLSFLNFQCITDFQKKVYKALIKIGFGEVISYEGLASLVGGKNYKRAVGKVLGANPFPLVIPCHRVLPKNYSFSNIGGFSAGKNIKKKLLDIENVDLRRE